MRSHASPTRDLAKQLLAFEEAESAATAPDVHAVASVCNKLRLPLATLVGAGGFRSLLERALSLAKKESPVFSAWEVEPDGSLQGLNGETAQSGAVLIAQFLELMFTFVGETFTLRLLQEAWPNLPYTEASSERYESK